MSIDRLLDTLQREASVREEELLKEARQEAEDIIRRAREEADDIEAEIAREEERRKEQAAFYEKARTRLDDNYRATARLNILLEAVKDKVREKMEREAGSPAHTRVMRDDYRAALARVGDGALVTADPATADALAEEGARNIKKMEGFGPGFTLVSADGLVTVDATLEAKLRRLWPALAPELLKRADGREER